ncbi:DNA polymerase III subunit gamma/tau [Mastigocladopsis repens]|uniref:DNA polymerase III subunit gamma/tau n=1 Tax=Mastigocladopsis repens TaxID=221287 RepID=UPI0003089CE2|nr:DNA polymerase III subunit gamma/tau [Mastigocladopsis repens]
MSYEPLHHKYRPKSFAELVGQEAIATTLTNAIRAAKIAPAYLFTGPRGTGKTSSARILAKSLNCLKNDKPTPQPCGVCDVCQGITKGYSLDVIEIDAASNTGVDNIRELIERAQFAPVQCRYKVYVVDECHMLSTAAFNALLKTLEEPPKHVVFVLATTDPQRVLPTIISRCQRFDFRRIDLEAMVKHLSHIAYKENINITLEAITMVAQLAQGGLRDAESLLDQLSLLSAEVTPDRVWDLVGSVSERDLLLLLNAIASNNPENVLDYTRKILDRGREPLIILQNLAGFYRDLLIAKTAPSRNDLVACTPQTWEALIDFAQEFDMSTILAGQQHLRTAEVQLKNTTQPRLWLEVTLLGLLPSASISVQQNGKGAIPPKISPSVRTEQRTATSRETPPSENNLKPVKEVTSQQTPTVSPTPPTSTPPEPPPKVEAASSVSQTEEMTEVTQYELTQVWQQVLANLQPISRRELLRQMCHLIEFDGVVARVAIKQAWYKQVQSDQSKIVAAFKETFKCDIKINLELATSSTSIPPQTSPHKKPTTPSTTPSSYEPPPAPSPEIPTPKTPTTKTSNTTNGAVVSTSDTANRSTTPSTPQPPASNAHWAVDEVEAAAQRLAQFFDGEIIRFTDDAERLDSTTTSEWVEDSEADDEF